MLTFPSSQSLLLASTHQIVRTQVSNEEASKSIGAKSSPFPSLSLGE
tara:strand:- start:356 stop:496 length:141 start_codon:yes stop_codon:yes gene_type:complete